jgi:glutathione peroxidase
VSAGGRWRRLKTAGRRGETCGGAASGANVFPLPASDPRAAAVRPDTTSATATENPMPAPLPHPAAIHGFSAERLDSTPQALADYAGKVLLIVNTASNCGFTPQYKGLEALYQRYRERGLVVLGFPCNQFGAQEPGSADEIGSFCEKNYGVSFPLFAKIDVNGDDTHPLFQHLKKAARGLLGSEAIKWNFTKFLVDRDGEVVKRYASATAPDALADDIEKLL